MSEDKMNLILKREGNKVIASQVFKDQELTDMDVLQNVKEFENKIAQAKQIILKANNDIVQAESSIPSFEKLLADFKKHEEWALSLQESKCRVAVDEHLEEAVKSIDDKYDNDPTLTLEQNNLQKYKQCQQFMANKVSGKVFDSVWKRMFFLNPIFKNPWSAAEDVNKE